MEIKHPDQLVTVTSCIDLGEAQILKSSLEASGIDVYIGNEALVSTYPSLGYGQEISLQVRAAQLKFARQILDTVSAIPVQRDDPLDETDECPSCGSVHVFKLGKNSTEAREGVELSPRARHIRLRCLECGHEWSPGGRRLLANAGLAILWGGFLAAVTLGVIWLVNWLRYV